MVHVLRFGAFVTLAASLAVVVGCSDEDSGGSGIRRQAFPRLEAEPGQIVLSAVPVGESTFKVVKLRNVGGSKLRISSIEFSNAIDTREFVKAHPTLPLILEAGEEADLRVDYSPRNEGTDAGWITIQSNDVGGEDLRIPISTTQSTTDLQVMPDRLVFVSPNGVPLEKTVTVTNYGNIPVSIADIKLSDDTSSDFTLSLNADERPELARDDSIEIGVTYTPSGQDTDEGTLVIQVDDATIGFIQVPLVGDEPAPEIDVNPGSVIFGAVDLNTETDVEGIVIQNRGTAPLNISRIAFAVAPGGVNEQFTLHDVPEGIDSDNPLVIEAEDFVRIGVSYHPTVDGAHGTAIAISSNDTDESLVTVPVSGRVRKPCISVQPESVSFGRVALGQESARTAVQVVNCGDLPLTLDPVEVEGDGFAWARTDGMPAGPIEIQPLGALSLDVWYTNRDLAEGALAEGTLHINNNTPDQPVVDVPLQVVGGGAPTCDLLIIPDRVNFGLVSRGQDRTRELQLVNRGTGACELRSQEIMPLIVIPIPGFDQVKFFLTRPVAALQVPPGAFLPFEITYRPDVFSADSARFTATFWDPFQMEERSTFADLQGVAGESNIEVIPGRLDFGQVTAGECASREERVTVYNTGVVDLCITGVQLDGPDCDEFVVVDRPVADADGCIVVTRNSPADVRLVYEPGNLGADDCDLVFESDASDNPTLRVPLEGEGIRDRRQTDIFEQTSGRQVDVLFVVDNSGSMSEEQDNLRDNFGDFITGAQQFQNDYQLGIVTTDMDNPNQSGRLLGDPPILRRAPGVENTFRDRIRVGTNGAGEEHGLEAAQAALSDPLAFDTGVACAGDGDCVEPDRCVEGFCGGPNRGFVREGGALEVVFVSDEDDFSPGALNFYVDFLKNIKGFRNESLFHAHAIVGALDGRARQCESGNGAASAGSRYVEVADRTNGQVFSICDADFGRPLQEIGNQAFGLPVQFFLSRPALGATITVTVDGQPTPDGWDYDEASNSVVFDEATVPQAGQTIQVDYEAQCFARRG